MVSRLMVGLPPPELNFVVVYCYGIPFCLFKHIFRSLSRLIRGEVL